MAIKTCPACGGENHENAAECLRCNADLSAVAPGGVPAAPLTPPPPMFPQGPQGVAEVRTNGMAIAALVLGISSLIFTIFTGIVGLVLGIIAAVQISGSGGRQKGMGMAITGIILSVILPIAMIMLIITPKLMVASRKAKDSTLKANVVMLRYAIDSFQYDTGAYPASLTDITVASPGPASGYVNGIPTQLHSGTYKGPYLDSQGGIGGGVIPRNPYAKPNNTVAAHWTYNPIDGKISFPTPVGEDAFNEDYSSY